MDPQDLEIDQGMAPPPQQIGCASVDLSTLFSVNASGKPVSPQTGKVFTLEEWDALFPPHHLSQIFEPARVVIRPLPTAPTTGEYVTKFNTLCQLHSIVPKFTIPETAKGYFTAKVDFGSHSCEEKEPYPSKRHAKDAVCRRALEILAVEEVPKKVPKKSKVSDPTVRTGNDNTEDDGENWVSMLVEMCQKKKHSRPTYSEFEASLREQQLRGLSMNSIQFACTVQVEAAPGLIFGSEENRFTNKAAAKRNAAKDAVLWLRANGLLEATSSSRQVNVPSPRHQTSVKEESLAKMDTRQSIAQLVHERSLRLGLSPPQFEMQPVAAPVAAVGPNFYTASAFFSAQDVQREPTLHGPLCQTEVVFGQKKAKEMCCKSLLDLLDKLIAQHLIEQATAEDMMLSSS